MVSKKRLKSDGKKKEIKFRPSSFFKVMVGEFTEFLIIPPKFAAVLDGFIVQNVYLKDYNNNIWRVEVSKVNGSLAFCRGWSEFVMYHLIDVGEFIVFDYVVLLPDVVLEECQIPVMPYYDVQPLQVSDPNMICFDDHSTPNEADFSEVFLSHPWLNLPGGLPCDSVTNKPGSQDIIRRDSSMRLWPVRYIENSRFTEFSVGWKEFARANNLQHGTLCKFSEVADQP